MESDRRSASAWDMAAFLVVALYLPGVSFLIKALSLSKGPLLAVLIEWSLFALICIFLRFRGRRLADIRLTTKGFLIEGLLGVGYMASFWLFIFAVARLGALVGGIPHIEDILPVGNLDRLFTFRVPRLDLNTAVYIAFALTAGICEETIFRGYLLSESLRLIPMRRPALIVGFLMSSLYFGLLHLPAGPPLFAISTFGGFCCTVAVLWRKNLTSAIVVHILFNLQALYIG